MKCSLFSDRKCLYISLFISLLLEVKKMNPKNKDYKSIFPIKPILNDLDLDLVECQHYWKIELSNSTGTWFYCTKCLSEAFRHERKGQLVYNIRLAMEE